jgi:hypothetical protein
MLVEQGLIVGQDASLSLSFAMSYILIQAFIAFIIYFEELFLAIRYHYPTILNSVGHGA